MHNTDDRDTKALLSRYLRWFRCLCVKGGAWEELQENARKNGLFIFNKLGHPWAVTGLVLLQLASCLLFRPGNQQFDDQCGGFATINFFSESGVFRNSGFGSIIVLLSF